MTLTAGTLGQLAPVDADGDGSISPADLRARADAIKQGVWADMPMTAGGAPCALDGARAVVLPSHVQLEARFACGPGELRQDFRLLRVLPSNYRVVLGRQVDGEGGRAFAQVPTTSLVLGARDRPGAQGPGAWEEAISHGLRRALRVDAAPPILVPRAPGAWQLQPVRRARGHLRALSSSRCSCALCAVRCALCAVRSLRPRRARASRA